MATRLRRAAIAIATAVLIGGCGIGGGPSAPAPPAGSSGPGTAVTAAVIQTRTAIAGVLGGTAVQLGNATRPYVPAESARLRKAPRAVYQVTLADQPNAGFVVVYEFSDAAAAVDAGNEEAGYLGTGVGKVQFPPDAQHVLRALGTTLVLYTWSPSASSDPTAASVAAALSTLGIGFAVPR